MFALVAAQMQVLNEWRAHDQVDSLLHCRAPLTRWAAWLDPNAADDESQPFQTPLMASETTSAEVTLAVLQVPIRMGDQFLGAGLIYQS